MKVRHTHKLPLRFYFESVEQRDEVCKSLAEIGTDRRGPYIQVNGAYAKICLADLQAHKVTLRVGKHKIALESL